MDASEFKTTLLSSLINTCHPSKHYDSLNDVFSFLFLSSKEKLFVYYIDDYVSLVCRLIDNEIVGIRIDSFLKQFLPKIVEENNIWKLSDSEIKIENIDFVIKCDIKDELLPKYNPKVNPSKIEAEPIYLDCLQPV